MTNSFNYDFWNILLEKLNELEVELKATESANKDFVKGQIMSLYDIATVYRSQLDAFGIESDEITNTDLEHFLFLK